MTKSKGLMINNYVNSYFEDIQLKKWEEYFYVKPREFLDLDMNEINKYIKENDIRFIHIPMWSNLDYSKFKDFIVPVIIALGDAPRRLQSDILKNIVVNNKFWGVSLHSYSPIDCIRDYFYPHDAEILPYIWGLDFSVFKNYNLPKDIDVSSTGKYSNYQMRREIDDAMYCDVYRIKFVRERKMATNKESHIEYAKFLNRSLFSVGGCLQNKSMSHYKGKLISDNVPKNFEISAVNTCLLNTEWGDREILGFKDGENCIIVKSPIDAVRKVNYYKDNLELLKKITDNGYNLVHKNNDIDITTQKFVLSIEKKLPN